MYYSNNVVMRVLLQTSIRPTFSLPSLCGIGKWVPASLGRQRQVWFTPL